MNANLAQLFPGFNEFKIETEPGIEIHGIRGGDGPALLLLHGHPQTLAIWHTIATELAKKYTVIATDLRGYGDSSKPEGLPDHSNYSKRVMAQDQVKVMAQLGFENFAVLAHDRGARVAHRLVRDYPQKVSRLMLLDIAPTLAMYEKTDREFAQAYFHWFWYIQPAPLPETMMGSDPAFYIRTVMGNRNPGSSIFDPRAQSEYERCVSLPGAIHGFCEDYRASAGIDLDHDRESIAQGQKITCPLLVLWGANGVVQRCFDPLAEWQAVATNVSGQSVPSGHYIVEEIPQVVLTKALDFFAKA